MLATCDDSLEGLRDRALLCFGFASGGRRRSEIVAADLRDLRKVGEDGYIYRLEYSKTQQAGVKVDSTPDKPILGAECAGALGLARGGGDPRRGDLSADLEGPGGSCPTAGLGGRDREAPGPSGGLGGGFWGS